MRIATHAATLATLITGVFLSMSAHSTDLLQVYREALANDAQFASARASLSAGQERIVQGRANILPVIGITGNVGRTSQDLERGPLAQSGSWNGNGYTISLSQPLLRYANWELYQQGKLATALSQTVFEQARQDVMVRVSQAYFDVLTAQDALTSVQAQKVAITEQLAFAKRNFEVGTTTITDTHEAQARFDLSVAQEFAAINDLEIKRTALQQIIGTSPVALQGLRPGVRLNPPMPAQIESWVSSAERQNYNVLSQEFNLEIARREIKRNRAGHLPTLDLVASRSHVYAGDSVAGGGISATNTNNIGVQYAIPLFAGFSVNSRIREAIALEEKSRADLESVRRSAAQSARQSYFGVNNGLAQIRALEAAEISSTSALESNRLGYEVGVRINIDVLNAQQQLFSTRRDLARARYDTVMNGLRLKAAAGTLTEQDLAVVNSLLENSQPLGSLPAQAFPIR